jgi:hypothetical protein
MRDRLPDHWRESYVREKGQVNESCGSFAATRGHDNRLCACWRINWQGDIESEKRYA